MKQKGFVSVLLFFLLSALCFGAYLAWNGVVRYSELAYKKQLYEYEFWLASGALEYAAEKIYKNKSLPSEGTLDLGTWPPDKKSEHKACVAYFKEKGGHQMKLSLEKNSSVKKAMSCDLIPDGKSNKNFFITNWAEHAQSK